MLYVSVRSHLFVFCLQKARQIHASTLALTEITRFPSPVLLGHGYMQHAGPGCRGTYDLLYYIYFIPVQNILKVAIAFACEQSFA